ncbi:MAG: DUF3347 domain-containing protein [Owenweeksia sp.]|nr:DUF3347 domain-containing protein [Owenweeksia sp.]
MRQVVINGTFTVDAAAQLAGKPSMMNPEAGQNRQEHDHATMEMKSNAAQEKLTVSDQQKSEISEVLQVYFQLKDALVASDKEQAAKYARSMEERVANVGMASMPDAVRERWMKLTPKLKSTLKEINIKANIDAQRKAFVPLSEAVVSLAHSFGPFEEPVYVMFCPMAHNDQGANRLSASGTRVLNPYYGDMMLRCGEAATRTID